MFALAFSYCDDDDESELLIESETDDFGEAIDDLFYARNASAAGETHWDGAHLACEVIRDGEVGWEVFDEALYAE